MIGTFKRFFPAFVLGVGERSSKRVQTASAPAVRVLGGDELRLVVGGVASSVPTAPVVSLPRVGGW